MTGAQKAKAQQILLAELERRRELQPLLLVDSILDGTVRNKLKMLLQQNAAELQAVHDAVDANAVVSKAALAGEITDLGVIISEIP